MSPGKSEKDDNQYVHLLIDNLPSDIKIVEFTFLKSLLRKYHILHVHWPDRLFRSESKLKTIMKRTLLILLMIRILILRTRVVWTVHNKVPHEAMTLLDKFFNFMFMNCVSSKIFLQKDPDFNQKCDFIIKHGNYQREVSLIKEKPSQQTNSLVCIGVLRPSKNIENLIRNFPVQNKFSLSIQGQPISKSYCKKLLLVANSRQDIFLNTNRLTMEELNVLYENCFCSIIPYTKIYNSGAALFSLSIPRPVIATSSESMMDLQSEVGPQWLQLIPQSFKSTDILTALDNLLKTKEFRDSLSPLSGERDWKIIGNQHLAVYSKV